MTDLIERLAREVFDIRHAEPARFYSVDGADLLPQLERFAALVANHCAEIAERTAEIDNAGELITGEFGAQAIRAAFPKP